jgi:hypothetical protein
MHQRRSTWQIPRSLFLSLTAMLTAALCLPVLPSTVAGEREKTVAATPAPAFPISKLLPARTVFLTLDEGFDAHQVGWDKTAASDSLSKTGVFKIGQQLVNSYLSMLDAEGTEGAEIKQAINEVFTAVQTASDKGYAVAVSLPEGNNLTWPRLTVVLPHGKALAQTLIKLASAKTVADPTPPSSKEEGKEDEESQCLTQNKDVEKPAVSNAEEKSEPAKPKDLKPEAVPTDGAKAAEPPAAGEKDATAEVSWKKEQIGSREIYRDNTGMFGLVLPGFDVAFWEEHGHFVFVVGFGAVKSTLDLADGKHPDITTGRIWKELHQAAPKFDRRSFGWIDVKELRKSFDDVDLNGEEIGGQFLEFGGSLLEVISGVIFMPFQLFGAVGPNRVVHVAGQNVAHLTVEDNTNDFPIHATQPPGPLDAGDCSELLVAQLPAEVPDVSKEQKPTAPKTTTDKTATDKTATDKTPTDKTPKALVTEKDAPEKAAAEKAAPEKADGEKTDAEKETPDEPVTAAKPITLKQVVTAFGLETVQHYSWQSGYKGRALWSESFLSAPGPKTGLLAFTEQPAIHFNQLPPLPKNTVSFSATSIELKNVVDSSLQLVKSIVPSIGGVPAETLNTEIADWRKENGALVEDVTASLDSLVCLYNDGTNGPMTFGPVLVWKVKDAARLRRGLDQCVAILTAPNPAKKPAETEKALKSPDLPAAKNAVPLPLKTVEPAVAPKAASQDEAKPAVTPKATSQVEAKPTVTTEPAEAKEPPDLKPAGDDAKPEEPEAEETPNNSVELELKAVTKTSYGRQIVGLQISDYPLGIAYTVDDNWLAISFNSQLLEAFLLRVDGKLPKWEPTVEHQDALKDLPEQFTSISVDDPRTSLPSLVSFGYCGLVWIEAAFRSEGTLPQTKKLMADIPNLPPAELIVQPLFPNLSVTTVDKDGIHWYTRNSLPSFSAWNYSVGYVGVLLFAEMGLGDMISF